MIRSTDSLEEARKNLDLKVSGYQFAVGMERMENPTYERVVIRDCVQAMRSILKRSSDNQSGFSVTRALWDIARNIPREDLKSGFFAQMLHIIRGVKGKPTYTTPADIIVDNDATGRDAAILRSQQLDELSARVQQYMDRYEDGLQENAQIRRKKRVSHICNKLGANEAQWHDWQWQIANIIKDPNLVAQLIPLSPDEYKAIAAARPNHIPFGITPYYASLMDDLDESENRRDLGIRSQVLPDLHYIQQMTQRGHKRDEAFDFMLERDTSPIDLVTRRYPGIVILKPFNTCRTSKTT